MRVLVTGGGGFLGKAIVKRLVERGESVCSFSRKSYPQLEKMGVEQLRGDISDREAVDTACKSMELVFHTVAKPPPWGAYSAYYQTNVAGTQNVIDACIRQKVDRLIHTSTPSVVFNGDDLEGVDESFPYPASYKAAYPKTKALGEQRVVKAADKGLKTIILRPHEIWGPGDPHFVPRIIARAGKLKQIGNGRNLVDTTYIDNAADAHLLAADKLAQNPGLSGKIYFLSQGEPIPAWDMINAILKAAGLEPVKGSIPYPVAWTIGAILESIYKTLRLPGEPQMTRFLAEAVTKAHWFDISAARRDLGYSPGISITEGLKRLENWLKNEQTKGATE